MSIFSKEPRGELARYAFGYSDKKPGWSFWLILAGMVLFILCNLVHIGRNMKNWICKKEWRVWTLFGIGWAMQIAAGPLGIWLIVHTR